MSEWIKCTDRLPKENISVLVWDGNKIVFGSMCHGSWYYYTGMFPSNITHWMNLPDAPE